MWTVCRRRLESTIVSQASTRLRRGPDQGDKAGDRRVRASRRRACVGAEVSRTLTFQVLSDDTTGERGRPLNIKGAMMRSHAILHGIAARSVGVQRVFSKD